MQGFFGVGGQIGCQFLRKARTDILAPVCHFADGGCQFLAGAFLVDVAGATRLEHLRGMRFFGEHAQNEDGTARVPAFYFLDQLYPASPGHGKVENGDVPVELANELERFIAVLCLADHIHVMLRGQDLFETTPNDRMVVRDNNSHGVASPGNDSPTTSGRGIGPPQVPWNSTSSRGGCTLSPWSLCPESPRFRSPRRTEGRAP